MKSRSLVVVRLGLVSFFNFLCISAMAQSVLTEFSPGEVATAAQINGNFQALEERLNLQAQDLSANGDFFQVSVDCTDDPTALNSAMLEHASKMRLSFNINGECSGRQVFSGPKLVELSTTSAGKLLDGIKVTDGAHVDVSLLNIANNAGGLPAEVQGLSSLSISFAVVTCDFGESTGVYASNQSRLVLTEVTLSPENSSSECGFTVSNGSLVSTSGNIIATPGRANIESGSMWFNSGAVYVESDYALNVSHHSFLNNTGAIVSRGYTYVGQNSSLNTTNSLEVYGDLAISDHSQIEGFGVTRVYPYPESSPNAGGGGLGLSTGSAARFQSGGLEFIGFAPEIIQLILVEGSSIVLGAVQPDAGPITVSRIDVREASSANFYGFDTNNLAVQRGSFAQLSTMNIDNSIWASGGASLNLDGVSMTPSATLHVKNSTAEGVISSTAGINANCIGLAVVDVTLPAGSTSNCKSSEDWSAL